MAAPLAGHATRLAEAARRTGGEHGLVAVLDVPRLLRDPVWRRGDPELGRGTGVVLVPGFGVGDASLALTRIWLRRRDFRPVGARIGLNVGCTTELVHKIEGRLERHVRETGGRVVLIGHSRGGGLARIAAVRRPDLVRGLVMPASPVLDPLGGNPGVARAARRLARFSAAGLPGLLDEDCLSGTCYDTDMEALRTPLPSNVPALAVYSRNDRITSWRLCLDPCADCAEVSSSHTGMALDSDVYRLLETRLTAWAGTTP
ncbi:alpha/beta hydrolase [Lentzea californiensis]|uniref:alpha/beta hydrolase n=1 Tax=Lentzea californiensis TaxID=438851 RepID=UPI002165C72C|nr:alpha/beta hydrolase [Lentzea californiensis]MCR3750743.1 Alpha/beta hydrolase family [Lentzea californiensis]